MPVVEKIIPVSDFSHVATTALKLSEPTSKLTANDQIIFKRIEARLTEVYGQKLSLALRTQSTADLYNIVPAIQRFMNDESLGWLEKCAMPEKVITALGAISGIAELQKNISEATQRMEAFAQALILEKMACLDDAGKTDFIRRMGMPGTNFNCPVTNFERIPELDQERSVTGINEDSHVLILGTGSLSISGLYFASFGARVTLVDRDPRAINAFMPIYNILPAAIQKRITLAETCDARDFEYPKDITHICLAALLEPKEPVITRLRQMYCRADSVKAPKILLRMPRKDLMRFFYYDIDQQALKGFEVLSKIDIGYKEQPANTLVLKIRKDF